jgi:hypothetical protein
MYHADMKAMLALLWRLRITLAAVYRLITATTFAVEYLNESES